MSASEVAQLRERIAAEYAASQLALTAFASGTAKHAFITARTENIQSAHERLIELVGPEEAMTLLATTVWSPEDRIRQ